jgi:CelD/BcsL family acetyltransferase involved in cellulose biosynthesis
MSVYSDPVNGAQSPPDTPAEGKGNARVQSVAPSLSGTGAYGTRISSSSVAEPKDGDLGMLPMQQAAWIWSAARRLAVKQGVITFHAGNAQGGQHGMPMVRIGTRVKRLSLLGADETGEPSDLAWVSDASLDTLTQRLARQPLAIDLPRVPAASPSIGALKRAFARRGFVLVRRTHGTPFIDLDASWADPQQKFNAGRRSDFRRAERHAEKLGGMTFEVHESVSESGLDRLLDEAYDVEARSWKGKARSALAHDHVRGPFFREYAHAAMRAGILRLSFMRVGGRAVGMQIAIQSEQRFWLLKIGYDPACARCSPGNLLMLHTIAYAAQQGLCSYEFLGTAAPWTMHWTKALRPFVRVRAYPASVQGMLALLQDLLSSVKFRLRSWRHLMRGTAA